jgi:hypothetical protein
MRGAAFHLCAAQPAPPAPELFFSPSRAAPGVLRCGR